MGGKLKYSKRRHNSNFLSQAEQWDLERSERDLERAPARSEKDWLVFSNECGLGEITIGLYQL
jgi:hypothetical protein